VKIRKFGSIVIELDGPPIGELALRAFANGAPLSEMEIEGVERRRVLSCGTVKVDCVHRFGFLIERVSILSVISLRGSEAVNIMMAIRFPCALSYTLYEERDATVQENQSVMSH
jgi:hypothetical protein